MKNSFILYLDQYEPIKNLTAEQKGKLLDVLFLYNLDENPTIEDPIIKLVFGFFKTTFDRDTDKYLKRCDKNRENVRKRWNRKDTIEYDRIRSGTKHTDSDSDSGTDSESDNGNDKKKKTYMSDTIEFRLSKFLFNHIKKRKPDFKEPDLQKWSLHVDYMIRIDKRNPEHIKKLIKLSQADTEFWQNNILSTQKLRKQFDQIDLKLNNSIEESTEEDHTTEALRILNTDSEEAFLMYCRLADINPKEIRPN